MTHYLYCPCGSCPVRPMRAGQAPRCVQEERTWTEFTHLIAGLSTDLAEGRRTDSGGVREHLRAARVAAGRPADPNEEWRSWLAEQIEADRRQIERAADLLSDEDRARSYVVWQAADRIRKREAMARVAASAEPTWITRV